MKTPWHRNAFRITGPLWRETPALRRASDAELWGQLLNSWDAGDLRYRCADQSLSTVLHRCAFLLVTNHIHLNINTLPLILFTDLQNCTTIGFAGSEAKVAWLKEVIPMLSTTRHANLAKCLKRQHQRAQTSTLITWVYLKSWRFNFVGTFSISWSGSRWRRWPRVINTRSAVKFRGGFDGHLGWRHRVHMVLRNHWKSENLKSKHVHHISQHCAYNGSAPTGVKTCDKNVMAKLRFCIHTHPVRGNLMCIVDVFLCANTKISCMFILPCSAVLFVWCLFKQFLLPDDAQSLVQSHLLTVHSLLQYQKYYMMSALNRSFPLAVPEVLYGVRFKPFLPSCCARSVYGVRFKPSLPSCSARSVVWSPL